MGFCSLFRYLRNLQSDSLLAVDSHGDDETWIKPASVTALHSHMFRYQGCLGSWRQSYWRRYWPPSEQVCSVAAFW